MHKLAMFAVVLFAAVAGGCIADTGEEIDEPVEVARVAESAQAIKVGDKIRLVFDMKGKLFPQGACNNMVGDLIGVELGPDCYVVAQISECRYDSSTKLCECSSTVVSTEDC